MSSNLKWILGAVFLSVFVRLFLISIYRIPTNVLQPQLFAGDVVVANQLSYGLRFPWMPSGYFESEPQIGDIIIYKVKKNAGDEISIKRIVQKTELGYLVQLNQASENIKTDKIATLNVSEVIQHDQILSRAWFVVISVGTTQDSISEEKSIRWNRFLTMIH